MTKRKPAGKPAQTDVVAAVREGLGMPIQPSSLPNSAAMAHEMTPVKWVRPNRTLKADEAGKETALAWIEAESKVGLTRLETARKYLIPNIRSGDDLEAAKKAFRANLKSPIRASEFGRVAEAVLKDAEKVALLKETNWDKFVTACRGIAGTTSRTQTNGTGKTMRDKGVEKIIEEVQTRCTEQQLEKVALNVASKVTNEKALFTMVLDMLGKISNAETLLSVADDALKVARTRTEQESLILTIEAADAPIADFLEERKAHELEAEQAAKRNQGLQTQHTDAAQH